MSRETFTPNYGIIDYSKHVWLVDKPHAEKPPSTPGTIWGAEQKKNATHLLTMESKGMWIIDAVTTKSHWNYTLTYFTDNFLNVYEQINNWDSIGSPTKSCPEKISDHECSTECELRGGCKYYSVEYDDYKCVKNSIPNEPLKTFSLKNPMPDELIEKFKSGEWILPTDATRPKVIRQYTLLYMENAMLKNKVQQLEGLEKMLELTPNSNLLTFPSRTEELTDLFT